MEMEETSNSSGNQENSNGSSSGSSTRQRKHVPNISFSSVASSAFIVLLPLMSKYAKQLS